MKTTISALLILVFQNCVAQGKSIFGLYFGNDFKSDSVTILINGVQVAKNIELRNRMYDPKNLMIEQNNINLTVMPYNGPMHTFKPIQIKESTLILDISMNNLWRRFTLDLRKGKYLYARYRYLGVGWSSFKILEIKQDTLAPLII